MGTLIIVNALKPRTGYIYECTCRLGNTQETSVTQLLEDVVRGELSVGLPFVNVWVDITVYDLKATKTTCTFNVETVVT